MAVTRLDAAAAAATAGSLTFEVTAGSDRLMVCVITTEQDNTQAVSSVDYGGQAMVKAREEISGSGTTAMVSVWYILEAGIAARSTDVITPTYSDTVRDETMHAASYENVNQVGGTATLVENQGNETNATTPNPATNVDVTEAVGNLVVAGSVSGNAATAAWQSDMTEQTDQQDSSMGSTMADRLSVTAGNITVECTWSSQNRRADVTCEFAATGIVIPRRRIEGH